MPVLPDSQGLRAPRGRWTLLIVRELLFRPMRFTEIEEGLPGISRSVLSDRLKRLQQVGICEKTSDGAYRFTEAWEALRPVLKSMGEWGRSLDHGRSDACRERPSVADALHLPSCRP